MTAFAEKPETGNLKPEIMDFLSVSVARVQSSVIRRLLSAYRFPLPAFHFALALALAGVTRAIAASVRQTLRTVSGLLRHLRQASVRFQVSGFALLVLLCGRAAAADSAQAEYVLQPMDLIKIEVFQEPDLERQVRVSQDSTVSLPLINRVDVKDKTVQQAQDAIRDLYNANFLVNPQINLTVMEYAKRDVKVLGQVAKAGAVDIPTDRPLKLLDAIALAGGFTRLADRKRVTLTRTDADGKTTTTEINADNIIQSKDGDTWVLRQGDVINVPERLL